MTSFNKKESIFELAIEGEESVYGKTVLVAAGMKEKRIRAPGEEILYGDGVSYCAFCDGVFFRGKDVAVVGGGNTAFEEFIYFSELANKVYLIHRTEKTSAEQKIIDKEKATPKIE